MALVGMVGYAQAGKDTFAKFLGYRRIAFADPLKQVALSNAALKEYVEKYGWEWVKENVHWARPFLQSLGVAVREIDPQFWVQAAFKNYDPEVDTVFTDVRFPNEVEAIQHHGGIIVRVDRADHGPANDHVSEFAWQAYRPDFHYLFMDGDFKMMEVVAHDLRNRLA